MERFAAYFKAQKMFGVPKPGEIDYSQVVELDLSTIYPSLAGPKRPQDRIDLDKVKPTFPEALLGAGEGKRLRQESEDLAKAYKTFDGLELRHGDVLIAAITSCTNTSNPGVLLAAGCSRRRRSSSGLR